MTVASILMVIVQISVFLVVLSLGLRASLSDLSYLFRRPGQLIKALISIYVVMPVFAILVVKLFALTPVVEVALIALSVSPVPPILPMKALKSGGEKSFTFGLLAAVSVLSLIVIPLVFQIFDATLDQGARFSMAAVLKTLLISVIIPLVLGMLIRQFAVKLADQYAGLVGKIGLVLVLLCLVPILLALLPFIWSLVGNGTILAFVAFALVGVTAGHFLGGPDPANRSVVALATALRHPAIAITLATANVDEAQTKLVAAAVFLYLLVTAVVVGPYVNWLGTYKAQREGLSEI